MTSPASALELRDVVKSYPGVQALRAVSLDLKAGEVHALVGENGAGKSTIVKILGGVIPSDSGTVHIAGQEAVLSSPLAARRSGIAVIHQELNLIPGMTIAQNLLLGREELAGRFGLVSPNRRRRVAREMLDRIGLALDPDRLVDTLPVSEQQLVEIARALSEDAKVILMDEPTAALTDVEAESLFTKISELQNAGVAVLYISHRLDEVVRLADRITVLRDGAVVESGPASSFDIQRIVTAMVGRTIADHYPRREARSFGPMLLEVSEPTATGCEQHVRIRAGEIVGLAGLVGSGRSEWAEALFTGSLDRVIRLRGAPVSLKSASQSRQMGIGLVPGDRKHQGVFLNLTVQQNLTVTLLDRLSDRLGLLKPKELNEVSEQLIEKLDIRCANASVAVGTLSGGNQQKVAMAKWLARASDVLILDEPTRGVDIGAKEEIYRLILEIVRSGKGILLVSSELPELLALCDRIYIMRQGRFVASLDAESASQEQLISLASGA